MVDKAGRPVKLFTQEFDVGAVEQEVYRLLHD